ncbi:MAG: biotin transporter BioY [Bacteroidales bacterium]|nr:biotin transporter BioY [Bacteroidales bacterium]
MKLQTTILALCLCTGAFAQSIGTAELKAIRDSYAANPANAAVQNIISHTSDIQGLALNKASEGKLDNYFKYTVTPLKSAPNQYTSGRCWLFASLNGIRHFANEKFNVKDFRFSHNFDSFWDLFEKSNLFLEGIIATANEDIDSRAVATYFKTPVGDGAAWNFFVNLAEKYGVAPEGVMPETVHSNATDNMRNVLKEKLRMEGWKFREKAAAGATTDQLRAYKVEVMKDVYKILAYCLGEPPTEFTWRYTDKKGESHVIKTTPQEFYKMIVPADFGFKSMVMIMNDPTREYYKVYSIAGYTNTIEGTNWVYLNLPNDEIKAGVLASIKNNEAVYTSSDWRKGMNKAAGTIDVDTYDLQSLFGMDFAMDKKVRILTRQSSSAHAMLIDACDTDENDRPVKWRFFNSWFAGGEKSIYVFSDEWFDEYMFRVALDRKYLGEKALKALDTKPVELPMWDYMN